MEVILNVKGGILSYIINGTSYGIAFDVIDKTRKYRLAVSMSFQAKDSVVQLS